MVARAVDEFGQVDILCNNAAAPGQDRWIWEQTLDNWNATIAIDVTAAMLCTREVLNQSMLRRRRGVILNFSSTAGYSGIVRKTPLRHRQGVASGVHQDRRAGGRPIRHPVQLHRARQPSTPSCGAMGATHGRRARDRLRHPTGQSPSKALPYRISPRPRTSRTWRCSWPATKAGPSPANRSPSTPEGTCRDEHRSPRSSRWPHPW